MATLVLTTVGTLVGGPIGGAIGALIGNSIDRSLLAPSARAGPRLGDLSVQTSSYGSALPRIFGTMRVAGTVIWATDLREDTHSTGSAKAGTKTTNYSYSASFAVALSARPIRNVGRIWADGNLLRGAAGDWKSDLAAFRLYVGDEDQPVDPLIASAEGIAAAPAHRGLAYGVFEGLQLADYGNRIPSLTFELIAEDAPIGIGDIAAELSGGAIAASGGEAVTGYAASGDSVRAAIEALADAFPLSLSDDGTRLRLDVPDLLTIGDDDLGTFAGDERVPRRAIDRQSSAALPDAVAFNYYDPDRDYQAGLQRARRDGIGLRAQAIDLPVCLTADRAKALAEAALARVWQQRAQASATLPWRWLAARAGTRATLDGAALRIGQWSLEKMVLTLGLRPDGPAVAAAGASAGRVTAAPDAPAGTTLLALLDLPPMGDTLADTPQLWLAAAGTRAGWRRAEVSFSLDEGARWQAIGRTALPAVIGRSATVLGAGSDALVDRMNGVEIELAHAGMALVPASMDALVGGANAAMLGDELLQFGSATQLSPTRWRLGTLLRGRRGTEAAISGHGIGDRFVLIDEATLLPIPIGAAALGTTATVSAIGPGDGGTAATASAPVLGRALRPPAPVKVRAARLADGTISCAWVRRSRLGWAWLDGGDAPLGEDAERYRITITPSVGSARVADTADPGFDYSPADQAADGASAAAGFTITVVQNGTRAASLPANASFTL